MHWLHDYLVALKDKYLLQEVRELHREIATGG
jgi:hypothetical protein